jgi:hypothetical protein
MNPKQYLNVPLIRLEVAGQCNSIFASTQTALTMLSKAVDGGGIKRYHNETVRDGKGI